MHTLKKMWQQPYVKGIIAVLFVLVLALVIRSHTAPSPTETSTAMRSVAVTTAAAETGQQQVTLIGTVRAFSEANITSERAGRVTSVNATLGSEVQAGQVIATLENSAEQAAVLQAEGAYEAAVASAAQSSLSVSEALASEEAAENALRSSVRSAYTVANQIVRNDIDDFYASPESRLPGLRLSGGSLTSFLNEERVAYQTLLREWDQRSSNFTVSNVNEEVSLTIDNLNRTIGVLDAFLRLFPIQESGDRYSEAELQSFIATFTNSKSSLLNAISSVESSVTNLSRARDGVERARNASTGGSASTADAQVKQALGSLRAAQASLAETILRTPISGRVNSLDIAVGDFVSTFSSIAVVANNSALEIVTFAGDVEREQLVEGDEVQIDGVATGTVVTIAPSIDAETRKTEVRIATNSNLISNGDTVRITKTTTDDTRTNRILIPLTAVKFEATDGFIMQVDEDNMVTQKPVNLGPVLGNRVEVMAGITPEETFIKDVRGLTPGTTVTVRN